jgi:recombination protein RecA
MAKKNVDDKKGIEALLSGLRKKFGDESLTIFDSTKIEKVDVISTGSYAVDRALMVGGLPRGRITEIFGPESSGKTTLALSVCAQAQKNKNSFVAYIDVENALDKDRAFQLGVDLKRMIISQPQSAEEALNVLLGLVESGEFDVVVVDSVAALVPNVEAEGNIGDMTMGYMAKMMAQTLRKLTPVLAKTKTVVIFINQIRMKIGGGVFMGNPETTPGGKALPYAASIRIDIRRIGTVKDGEVAIGNNVRAKIVKNKVGPPYRTAEFFLLYDKGISYETDVFSVALNEGIIRKEGHSYFLDEEKIATSSKSAMAEFQTNPELVKKVVDLLDKNKKQKIDENYENI